MTDSVTDPNINRDEHDDTGGVKGKRTKSYVWNTDLLQWEKMTQPGATTTSYYESYTDTTTDTNLVYLGKASPGSATTDAAWQIKRYNKSTGQMSFADDITTFTKQWSARTGYSY